LDVGHGALLGLSKQWTESRQAVAGCLATGTGIIVQKNEQ
jgi:hypothetical protein